MRSSNKRSRSKPNRPRPLGNIVNRVFDSSGPEGKVRGTPQQIIDKYLVLARDAQLSGDRVAAENFLQHAEHYTRMLSEAQRELTREAEARQQQAQQQAQQQGQNQNRRFDQRDDGDGGQDSGETSEAQGGDRQNEGGGNRRANRRDDRQDRPERQERRTRQQRDPADPREARVGRDDSESMLVETPESRAEKPVLTPAGAPVVDNGETAARQVDQTGPQAGPAEAQSERAAPLAEPAAPRDDTGAEPAAESKPAPKPRKPRAAPTTRRAPRKPKADSDASEKGAQGNESARVAD